MCTACGDTGYITADESHANTIAIRKWCGGAPQVLVPCHCNPARRAWPWKDANQQLTKMPLDIIAANLPTYADLYLSPREVRLPSTNRLTKDAAQIMAALAAEGFEVVRKQGA